MNKGYPSFVGIGMCMHAHYTDTPVLEDGMRKLILKFQGQIQGYLSKEKILGHILKSKPR